MSVNEKMTAIADAIRAKTGGTEKLGLDAMVAGIGEVYEAGDYSRYATSIVFADWNLFGKPEVEVTLHDSLTSWAGIFRQSNINTTVTHLTVNSDALPVNTNDVFRMADNNTSDVTLKQLTLNVDLSQSTNMGNMFRGMRRMKVIDGTPINCSAVTVAMAYSFYLCNSLEEVRFEPGTIYVSISFNTSTSLSAETIQSIIDGLADLTGATAQTLTFNRSVEQKLTDAQKATITAKNWTLVY